MSTAVFGPLDVEYDEHVLGPRLWTPAQARWAAELLYSDEDPDPLLELCTGAGQIGPGRSRALLRAGVLVDSSQHACRSPPTTRPPRSFPSASTYGTADGRGDAVRRVVRAGVGRPAQHPLRSHPGRVAGKRRKPYVPRDCVARLERFELPTF